MSKMKELNQAVTELKHCSEALIGIAESLADLVTRDLADQPEEVKEAKVEPVTLEQVRAVLADKSRAGFTADVRALLEKHGVTKLSDIKPEDYADLMSEVEALGNG